MNSDWLTGWLQSWQDCTAPAGAEKPLAEQIKKEITPYVDAVEMDVLGNLIAWKKGSRPQGGPLLLTAHMDEWGVMVVHVEDTGFLRIVPVGPLTASSLVGEWVRFPNGTRGIIGQEKTNGEELQFSHLFLDIGAKDEEEALHKISLGDTAVVERMPPQLVADRVIGHALESRAGCAAVMQMVKQLGSLERDLAIVFSVQKEMGSRGVKTAAFRVDPSFALVIAAAPAGDTPGALRSEIRLGRGPAIKVMDGSIVISPSIRREVENCAKEKGIPYQLEVSPEVQGDAGAVQLTRAGVPTAVLSLPLRYPHTFNQVMAVTDWENLVQLGIAVLQAHGKE